MNERYRQGGLKVIDTEVKKTTDIKNGYEVIITYEKVDKDVDEMVKNTLIKNYIKRKSQ